MKVSEVMPSKYLKAEEIQGDSIQVIDHIEIESVGQGRDQDKKPVIYFRKMDKGLVLNKTNANTIANIYGDEMDEWPGRPITLFATEVQFRDEMVLAIRVRIKAPLQAGGGSNGDAKSAMNAAWAEFQLAHKDKSKDECALMIKTAIRDYFDGVSKEKLSAAQWDSFRRDGFAKTAASVLGDESHFSDLDIPF